MNLLYGEIVDVFSEDELPAAKVRIGCALRRISLVLKEEVIPGDTVLVCDGVAISKKVPQSKDHHVSGHSR